MTEHENPLHAMDTTHSHQQSLSSIHLTNQMAGNSSPYLRSHANDPVAWQEWNSKSLALAQESQRMIFLSIGYSACHWCHVMERESFSSTEIANILNRSFIPIKLDRESRPDLDDIYMNYVTATTGAGGWPLNVFLTPSVQPIFGGTYWPGPSSLTAPPTGIDDKPLTFLDVLIKMESIWRDERDRCLQSAADITRQLQAFSAEGIHTQSSVYVKGVDEDEEPGEPLDLDLLDDSLDHFVSRYDTQYGGFSASSTAAPKFPTPTNLTLLLRIGASVVKPNTLTRFGFPGPVPAILGRKSCTTAASMALFTLLSMSRSALRDQLGHGFHRYSVTRDWNLPHFEKMTYDNAQLLSAYCDAWALGRSPEILGTIYDLVEYFTDPDSPIVRPGGGWYSSEDSDSKTISSSGEEHSKEGAYYVWTLRELKSLLGEQDAAVLARHFGVKEDGNIPSTNDVQDEFLNQNVLFVAVTPSILAQEFGLKEEEVVRIIKEGKKKMRSHRKDSRGGRPAVDDKVVCSYNGLVISALARAANTLTTIDVGRATKSKEAAIRAVDFITSSMINPQSGRLSRISRPDSQEHQQGEEDDDEDTVFVDDYAYLIHGLIKLYDLTLDQQYITLAFNLQTILDQDFLASPKGGYFQTRQHPTTTINPASTSNTTTPTPKLMNLKPGTDTALPSPNGIIASNLLYLSSYASSISSSSSSSLLPASSSSTTSLLPISTPQPPKYYTTLAKGTIDAFAPEIIQHPFLYASLLTAAVLDQVGIKSLVVPSSMGDAEVEARALRGFGRTVVRLSSASVSGLRDGEVMICDNTNTNTDGGKRDTGNGERVVEGFVGCRLLREGELDADDADEEDGDQQGGKEGN